MLIGGLPGEIVAKESRLPRSGLVQRQLSKAYLHQCIGLCKAILIALLLSGKR